MLKKKQRFIQLNSNELKDKPKNDKIVRVDFLCDRWDVNADTVRRWIRTKKLHFAMVFPDGEFRFKLSDIEAYEEERKVKYMLKVAGMTGVGGSSFVSLPVTTGGN
jgi:hypothetical protein